MPMNFTSIDFETATFYRNSSVQGGLKAYAAGQGISRYGPLNVAQHKIRQHPFRKTQHVTDTGDHKILYRGLVNNLREYMREVFEYDNTPGARVLELVLQFAVGVKRVDVYGD